MFEPVRGGTRGGQAEFKWTDVSADKDRENYLGHSINAPTGRWQKNKDIHWYNRDVKQVESERNEEIRKIKELEAQAIAAVLGYEPTIGDSNAPTGSNTADVSSKLVHDSGAEARRKEKEEKRRRKEERKEEKRARKEQKKIKQDGGHEIAYTSDLPRRRSSRSRSPRLGSREMKNNVQARSRPRSRSPILDRRTVESDYDAAEREHERENDRRRYDSSARRSQPLDLRRYH